jgi:hypothetical protein
MMDVEDQTKTLARVYLVVAWAAVVVLGIVSGLVYRRVGVGRLIYRTEGQAVALAQQFVATAWLDIRDFAGEAAELDTDELREHPGAAAASSTLLLLGEERSVLKVRLYGTAGRILASTEAAEIGQHTGDTVVLEMASGRWWGRGRPDADSQLERVETLRTPTGTLRNVDLVITHVVIRPDPRAAGRAVGGVLGVYQDVGRALSRIRTTQALAMSSIIVLATLAAAAVWLRWRHSDA